VELSPYKVLIFHMTTEYWNGGNVFRESEREIRFMCYY